MKLEKVAGKFKVIENSELIPRNAQANWLTREMLVALEDSFLPTTISYSHVKCRWCELPYPLYVTRRKRCFIHSDILRYMMKNGKLVLLTDKLIMKLYWRGIFWKSISG